jgi:hypothetical protein
MADFSLQDLWWLKPKEPDNPLPAMQLGAQIVQNKARLDIAERELANDIARTSLMREEMLYKQQIQTTITEGNSAIAGAIASVDDWTDPEQIKRVYGVGARYPMVVGGKAWLGAEDMQYKAISAKRLQEEADSRIAARSDRAELNALIEERRRLLANSDIALDDARIRDIDSDIAFAERRTAIQEGNLALRRQELDQKGQRLSIRSQRMYDNELKALNKEEESKLKSTFGNEADLLRKNFNLKRRALTVKYYGPEEAVTPRAGLQTAEPPVTPPAVIAPNNDARAEEIRNSFKAGTITREQALQQLRELGFK